MQNTTPPSEVCQVFPETFFAALDRIAAPNLLAVGCVSSGASFSEGLVILPSTETIFIDQSQYSGATNINPPALVAKPRARGEIALNTGRRSFTDVHVHVVHFGHLERVRLLRR